MILDVLEIKGQDEPLVIEHVLDSGEIAYRNDVSALKHAIAVGARVQVLAGDEVRIQGRVRTEITLTCCRCLTEFRMPLDKRFEQIYLPQPVTAPDAEIELREGDLDVGFFRNFKIDFKAALLEQILLEVPMKPVCRPDCRGLCPQCGTDLNFSACSCPRQIADPRWAPLADLKRKLES